VDKLLIEHYNVNEPIHAYVSRGKLTPNVTIKTWMTRGGCIIASMARDSFLEAMWIEE
jgi:hypothetical protein